MRWMRGRRRCRSEVFGWRDVLSLRGGSSSSEGKSCVGDEAVWDRYYAWRTR